jgi:hypothetical protein
VGSGVGVVRESDFKPIIGHPLYLHRSGTCDITAGAGRYAT